MRVASATGGRSHPEIAESRLATRTASGRWVRFKATAFVYMEQAENARQIRFPMRP